MKNQNYFALSGAAFEKLLSILQSRIPVEHLNSQIEKNCSQTVMDESNWQINEVNGMILPEKGLNFKGSYPKLVNGFNNLVGIYMHETTSFKDFERFFYNRKILRKMMWIKGTRTLHYFISQLVNKKIIECPKGFGHWQYVCAGFCDKYGNDFSVKQLEKTKNPENESLELRTIIADMTSK